MGWQPLPLFSDARAPLVSTLGRANFTGAYLALLLPLTITATQTTTDKWQRVGFGVLGALQALVIIFTQARAAWIATIAGIFLLFWLQYAPHWSKREQRTTATIGIATLMGGLYFLLQQGIQTGGSIAARWTIWQASLRLLWQKPWLGFGADTLELYFPSVYPPQLVYYQGRGVVVDRAHNWLLDWSLNYGIVATIFLVALIAAILHHSWQQLTTNQNNPAPPARDQSLETHWRMGCMAAISVQLVGNLFLFDVAATAMVFWLLLAILTAEIARQNPPTTSLPVPAHVRQGAMGLFLLLLASAVWVANVRPLLADAYSWRGTQALSHGNTAQALADYETAVAFQQRRAAYQVAVALTAADLGDFDLAEKAMAEAMALRPTDPVMLQEIAGIYTRQSTQNPDKLTLAYQALDQALVLAPTIALTYQQYADLALRAGNMQMAQLRAQQATELDATDGISFGILGWTQVQAGDLVAAQKAFEQAVKWQPDSADFHLGLATVFFLQGDLDPARQAVAQSLSLDPNYMPALSLQSQLQ
jgi:Tfp pilus assembly protein PilF